MENMKQYTAETALFQKAGFSETQASLLAVGFTGMHQRLTDMDARIDHQLAHPHSKRFFWLGCGAKFGQSTA